MADQIQAFGPLTGTVYALIRNAAGQVWNGAAFVTYVSASLGSYDLPMTRQDTSGYYGVDVPAIPAGVYAVTAFAQAGGSPAESDPLIASGDLEWDGTNILPLSDVAAGGGLDAAGVRAAIGLASPNLDTQLDALPTAAEVAAQVTTDHGSGSYVRNTEPLDAAGVRTAVGLGSANLDTQLGDLPTNAELATALGAADDAVLAAIAALNNLSSAGAQAAAAAALAAYTASTAAQVAAVQTAVLAKLPAALTGAGNLKADLQSIKGTGLTSSPPFDTV